MTVEIVVLTADQQCFHRIARLCHSSHLPCPRWLSDPTQLVLALNASPPTETNAHNEQYAGIVLDLTPPDQPPRATSDGHTVLAAREAHGSRELEVAWVLGGLIASTSNAPLLPLLLVSSNAYLDEMLHLRGIPLIGRMAPSDDDLVWYRSLARLIASGSSHSSYCPSQGDSHATHSSMSSGRIRLSAQLWFDPDECILVAEQEVIPLTAREAHIMMILIRSPRRYHSAAGLAHRLTRPGTFPISEHSIEQTISGLRRKLGESRRKSDILTSRRGLGYALMPVEMGMGDHGSTAVNA